MPKLGGGVKKCISLFDHYRLQDLRILSFFPPLRARVHPRPWRTYSSPVTSSQAACCRSRSWTRCWRSSTGTASSPMTGSPSRSPPHRKGLLGGGRGSGFRHLITAIVPIPFSRNLPQVAAFRDSPARGFVYLHVCPCETSSPPPLPTLAQGYGGQARAKTRPESKK